jgi:hypothetical protein
MNVTPSFSRVLGVTTVLGRTFTDEEGEIGNTGCALVMCRGKTAVIAGYTPNSSEGLMFNRKPAIHAATSGRTMAHTWTSYAE